MVQASIVLLAIQIFFFVFRSFRLTFRPEKYQGREQWWDHWEVFFWFSIFWQVLLSWVHWLLVHRQFLLGRPLISHFWCVEQHYRIVIGLIFLLWWKRWVNVMLCDSNFWNIYWESDWVVIVVVSSPFLL